QHDTADKEKPDQLDHCSKVPPSFLMHRSALPPSCCGRARRYTLMRQHGDRSKHSQYVRPSDMRSCRRSDNATRQLTAPGTPLPPHKESPEEAVVVGRFPL